MLGLKKDASEKEEVALDDKDGSFGERVIARMSAKEVTLDFGLFESEHCELDFRGSTRNQSQVEARDDSVSQKSSPSEESQTEGC